MARPRGATPALVFFTFLLINCVHALNLGGFRAPVPEASTSWTKALRGYNKWVGKKLPVVAVNILPTDWRPAVVFLGLICPIPAISVGPLKVVVPIPLTFLVKRSKNFNDYLVRVMITYAPHSMGTALTLLCAGFQFCHEIAKFSARCELVLSLFEILPMVI